MKCFYDKSDADNWRIFTQQGELLQMCWVGAGRREIIEPVSDPTGKQLMWKQQ